MAQDLVGGQALIEGVMMRRKEKVAIATLDKEGEIHLTQWNFLPFPRLRKIPFIRGIVVLAETLYLGTKALLFSTEEYAEEKVSSFSLGLTAFFSFGFGILIFVLLPLFLTRVLIPEDGLFFNFIDGVFRVIVFFAYLLGISMMKDIKRVFAFHGAEHMAIHAYEHDEALTVHSCKKYPTMHPRCGTSFLLFVLFVSIFVFSFVVSESFLIKFFGRLLLLPVVASLSYELLRVSARFERFFFFKLLSYPGILLQKITTKKPDEEQLEVALKALKGVL